jgi:multidrug efflux pump subunit AcrA (membrane-fusion protein)
VGARAGDWVGVTCGLKAGEPVIVSGVGFLKDGDKVDVAPAPQASQEGSKQ